MAPSSWTQLSLALLLFPSLVLCKPKVLIYPATAPGDYYHESIPSAVEALKKLPDLHIEVTEDRTWFTDDRLSQYDAIIFVHNAGEVLDPPQKQSLLRYYEKGGNHVGIHSASYCMNTTDFFIKQNGAVFKNHPDPSNATVEVYGPPHPSTAKLPTRWNVFDEMYNFYQDPRDVGAVVVLIADESTYAFNASVQEKHGSPHPLAWYQERGAGVQDQPGNVAGRSFYTSLGHANETWQDPTFMSHILGGITWALDSKTTKATNASALVGNSASHMAAVPGFALMMSIVAIMYTLW